MAPQKKKRRGQKTRPKKTFKETRDELKKIPRERAVESSEGKRPGWHFRIMDLSGRWGFCPQSDSDGRIDPTEATGVLQDLSYIREKLSDFETMKWSEISGHRHHTILVEDISTEAQSRLEEIGQNDVDELFSFAFHGRGRLWGIRDNEYFKILWWDTGHEVYLYKKKHT